jgi:hypothetical protein
MALRVRLPALPPAPEPSDGAAAPSRVPPLNLGRSEASLLAPPKLAVSRSLKALSVVDPFGQKLRPDKRPLAASTIAADRVALLADQEKRAVQSLRAQLVSWDQSRLRVVQVEKAIIEEGEARAAALAKYARTVFTSGTVLVLHARCRTPVVVTVVVHGA